jgi:AP-1 complex subunit beta-1
MSTTQPKKPREIRELKEKLADMDNDVKQEAIRGIISYMTNGKDVSSLFMDVLKNITTTSLQLKKLIYLYVMSYAKVHPDLAILGVNTFRKVPLIIFRTLSTSQTHS